MTTHHIRPAVSCALLAALVFAATGVAAQQPGGNNNGPDTPGTGRFPAIKEEVVSLPAHVVYRPADLTALGATKLGVVAFNTGRLEESRALAAKAYELRDKTTEYERLYIDWNHASRVVLDPKAIKASLERLTTEYPRDFAARNNFGVFYNGTGEYEAALKEYQAAADLAPDEPGPVSNAAYVLLTLGRPRRPLTEIARQAAAAITLADRYTDTFARGQRRKQPRAAAEIQQSLLPPRISRVSGGEVAGNVLPSYEVAGDWYDVVENLDGIWITLADGLGPSTRAAASSAVALGALRAARRSGAGAHEAMMLMHRTLREMPGPAAAMTAVAARWDPTTFRLEIVNCGQVKPIVIRADEQIEVIDIPVGHGLGGRAGPRPARRETTLAPGDRLIICSDGVIHDGTGRAGLDYDGVSAAALQSDDGSAADTVREVHKAALAASSESLRDDATVVCLAVE